mmetsp:Transcript_24465/g.57527  ORF Transcript_24465/g.57527 Transcript_24465/m.57527 type:complete len:571 (+) Transcript_24465:122-1834(+)
MLRQALDEAEIHEKQLRQKCFLQDDAKPESSNFIPTTMFEETPHRSYGTASGLNEAKNNVEHDIGFVDPDDMGRDCSDGDEDNSLEADEYWKTERNSTAVNLKEKIGNIVIYIWSLITGFFVVMLDVENVWDSPATSEGRKSRRRNHFVLLFWFFILSFSYTIERVTFKLLVDRSGPFRLLAIEVVAFTHALMLGCGMLLFAALQKDFRIQPLGIPLVDVGLMALVDTVGIILVFLTGYHVAPTLTVILVQFTLPLTALISHVVSPHGYLNKCCSMQPRRSNNNDAIIQSFEFQSGHTRDFSAVETLPLSRSLPVEHVSGSIIISVAVLLALCPSIYTLIDKDFFTYATTIPIQTAFNTILFASSCLPAAASQLYKEYIFHQYKQPVEPDHLNFLLSVFQCIFASITSPLVYILMGVAASDDWIELYPSSDFSKNFGQGLQCFLGVLDEEEARNGYFDTAICENLLYLVVLHSLSVIFVGFAVDKIVKGGATKVMYRGISAGIILSVVSLYLYDLSIPDFNYGPAIDSLNLFCLILLVLGSEIYHRVNPQDASFETIFPEIESFFIDDTE